MNNLKRKLFGLVKPPEGGGGGLPNTYEQVDYIQSYGLSYINTGITTTDNTKIEMECAASDISPSTQHSRVILSAGTSSANMIAVNLSDVSGVRVMFGSSWVTATNTVNVFEKMKLTLEQGSLTLEQSGVSVTDTFTTESPTYGTIYLYNLFYSTSLTPTGKVYSLKIYDGNTLVRDYIPCYRKSDKELGLYDLVSQTFFSNAGVGSFDAKYLDFPSGYTQVKYIDSSASQAIDLNLKFSSNHRIDMNLMPLWGCEGDTEAYFGGYDGSNNSYLGKGNRATWRIYYGHGSGNNQKYLDPTETNYQLLKAICADRSAYFYVNTMNSSLTGNTYTNNATAYLFARHNKTSSTDVVALPCKIRMYNCNIYLSGTRIRTFVPCYRNSDSVAGMYDLNNDVFYASFTGTDFTKGADV